MSADLLLFLLLPVAAASGWWVARRSQTQSATNRSDYSNEYFTGLNYLLNEQPDKAVDVFIKMLEVDSDTVETHLALGNLFRRRGEGDRAIRIHQNLIARPTLTQTQRSQALLELGKDYMRAGFLDRAENLFLELVDNKEHRSTALTHLLDIYQQERDWEKAITVSHRIETSGRKQLGHLSAQFCCELAEQACQNGEHKSALRTIKRALAYDKRCVRANLLWGKIEQDTGNFKLAIKVYKQVEKQDPTYLSEIVEPVLSCYKAMGRNDEAEAYLSKLSQEYGGVTASLALAELTRLQAGDMAAMERILASLDKSPSIRAISRLVELQVANSQGETKDVLNNVKTAVDRLLAHQSPYRCENCGFQAKTLHWQCPTCRAWNTVKPLQKNENLI